MFQDVSECDGLLIAGLAIRVHRDATYGQLKLIAARAEQVGYQTFPIELAPCSDDADKLEISRLFLGICVARALDGDPLRVGLVEMQAALSKLGGTDWDELRSALPPGFEAEPGTGLYCTPWGLSRQAAALLHFGVPGEFVEATDEEMDEFGYETRPPDRPTWMTEQASFFVNCTYDYRSDTGVWGLAVGGDDNDEKSITKIDISDSSHELRLKTLGGSGEYFLLCSGSHFSF